MYRRKDETGMALVVTLLALALITSMVVEFAYAVYIGTNSLYNWKDAQRLSLMARSGVTVSAKLLSGMLRGQSVSYPGSLEMPVENPFEDFSGVITVRAEDERSKLNLNALIYQNGTLNQDAYQAFQRLLRVLSLDEKIADRVADWIDPDSEARAGDSEAEAKNTALHSVDELLFIKGITRKDYETLTAYVTVQGTRDNLVININGAEPPVLMSLSESIDRMTADKIVQQRDYSPFENIGQVQNVVSFQTGSGIAIVFKGKEFSLRSQAESGGIKRIIEMVFDSETGRIVYWKEY
jgi:general secretion pathway protein K